MPRGVAGSTLYEVVATVSCSRALGLAQAGSLTHTTPVCRQTLSVTVISQCPFLHDCCRLEGKLHFLWGWGRRRFAPRPKSGGESWCLSEMCETSMLVRGSKVALHAE